MANWEIRPPNLAEAEKLSQFAASRFCDTFGHLYHPDDLKEHLEARYNEKVFSEYLLDENMFLVAAFNKDGEIIGYAKAGDIEVPIEPSCDNARELHRLYVRDDMKGSGLGMELYNLVLQFAQAQGARELYLGVWSQNARAIAFYSKQGFEIVGKYLYQVGRTFDDERIMRLALVK
jgi:ribosomal protein S18 acetylase RimI-like enzyme